MDNVQLVRQFQVDQLAVCIYESRKALSEAAARDVAERMKELLQQKESIRMVFAPAASATDFLVALVQEPGIDWSRVTGFHLDEYVGKDKQRISVFAKNQIFGNVAFGNVHYMNPVESVEDECTRYAELLQQEPLDISCIGIGENGHLAYNEPHSTDFQDPLWVKPVIIDDISRNQALKDGTFESLAEVPALAITMTIPAIFSASHIYVVVPDLRKSKAVMETVELPVSNACPASYLRKHDRAKLYLDMDSSSLLKC